MIMDSREKVAGSDKRERVQSIMMEVEGYRRQMESTKNEMRYMDATLEEIGSSIAAIEALGENKDGTEILVNLGSGSFVKARLKDTKKVIVGVGAGLSLEKDLAEAKKIMEERRADITKAIERFSNNAAEMNARMMELDQEYRRLMTDLQAEQR
jgi:prefoldin alpha subunit